MTRRRTLGLLAVLVLSVPLLTGCGIVKVRYDAGATSMAPDDTLRVSFADTDPKNGDWWFVVGEPDSKLLKDEGPSCSPAKNTCDSSEAFTWEFLGKSKGSTDITFRYCYRSQPAHCQANPGRGPSRPVTLHVQIKEITSLPH
jgi:hypothetical protein